METKTTARTIAEVVLAAPVIRGRLGVYWVNKDVENRHITRILAYSAMKIMANLPPPYSVLNPETSSLSPSAKSKGARFVSAMDEVNQATNTGIISNARGTYVRWRESRNINEATAVRQQIRMRDNETS